MRVICFVYILKVILMNKSEIIKAIAEKSEVTIKDAKTVVDAFEEVLMDVLAKGETVMFPGFGSFSVAERAERIGRNFKTGKNVTIPASKHVKFKAGKALKEAVK